MKRWIPKVGETVTLKGRGQGKGLEDLPLWTGKVVHCTRRDCDPGTVYLFIEGCGYTTAAKDEITIHAK